ncbi:MAG: DegV family protein [Chloroflexi bacterium]|nr:DegV family protein [Chloroflexota bacterium]
MSIRIVTDSTADLSPELAAEHNITVVAASVLFGDEELLDGVDIQSRDFYTRLASDPVLPTTSQPAPGAFQAAYQQLADEGATEILSIHVSEKLSGTIGSARQGAEGVEGVRIEHVNSALVTMAMGLGVIASARAAAGGASLDEVRALAEAQFARTHCYFLLDTLEYLQRGGRIGRAGAAIGTLLRVKPLLTIRDGEVEAAGRVRTRKKAVADMLRRVSEVGPIEQMMAAHGASPGDSDDLVRELRALAPDAELITGEVGPAIGVHTGPGMLACAVVTAEDSPPTAT